MEKYKTICIIDDDAIYAMLTRKKLLNSNFCESVSHFANGELAFQALKKMIENQEELPDIILLDINMPIWDGWDFLDEFSKLSLEKKIILLVASSSNHPHDIEKAKSYPIVCGFVEKPITIEKILAELND